ncbi:MAG: DNA polymerase III subunit beta [Mycoplasmataceae bacterium]|nr:DNA polymerase III subunit beta [Mycoplasmataceae bacterium]
MEIKINKVDEFKNIIKSLSGITDNNSFRPVLSCLNFMVNNGVMTIISGNEIISVNKLIADDIYTADEDGSFLVNAKVFEQIFSKIKGSDTIIKKTQDNSLYIKSSNSEYFINLYSENNYPKINFAFDSEKSFKLSSSQLSKSIKKTIFAATEKGQRVILNGVNIKFKDKNLVFTATDGFRVARHSIFLDSDHEVNETVHIKAMKEIYKLITEGSDINISLNKEWLYIEENGSIIKSKVIEGIYPNLDRIFPKERLNSVSVSKSEIIDIIDRALVIDQTSNEISFSIDKEKLKVKNNQHQVGNAEVSCESHTYKGSTPIVNFSVNPKFIIDALKSIDSKDVRIDINDALKPVIIYSDEDKSMFNLIQPLKV